MRKYSRGLEKEREEEKERKTRAANKFTRILDFDVLFRSQLFTLSSVSSFLNEYHSFTPKPKAHTFLAVCPEEPNLFLFLLTLYCLHACMHERMHTVFFLIPSISATSRERRCLFQRPNIQKLEKRRKRARPGSRPVLRLP